jgi:hypothetical protein
MSRQLAFITFTEKYPDTYDTGFQNGERSIQRSEKFLKQYKRDFLRMLTDEHPYIRNPVDPTGGSDVWMTVQVPFIQPPAGS